MTTKRKPKWKRPAVPAPHLDELVKKPAPPPEPPKKRWPMDYLETKGPGG